MASASGSFDPFDYTGQSPHDRDTGTNNYDARRPGDPIEPDTSDPFARDTSDPWPSTQPDAGAPFGRDRNSDTTTIKDLIAESTGKPPIMWLVIAAGFAFAGIGVAIAVGRSAAALGAWALSGPLAIGALAIFTRLDIAQRARATYNETKWAQVLYGLALFAAAIGVILSGWLFANWWARQ